VTAAPTREAAGIYPAAFRIAWRQALHEISIMEAAMQTHRIVSRDEWLAARTALLAKEKEFTHARDRLSAARRTLPWVKVDKDYVFDTAEGKRTLAELFDGRSQLIVYHFMLAPGWKDGCIGCSFLVDHIDGALAHLAQRDVAFVTVSRAPLAEIEAYKARMGWHFRWVSSYGSDFNYDFHVSFRPEEIASGHVPYNYQTISADIEEMPGASVFAKDAGGAVYHTYSTFARGLENVLGTYALLDMTPKGRDEHGPRGDLSDWVKRHDEYGAAEPQSCCGGSHG
jgi:predicted dithiol-disulfide oxidoreductase (DUF899 family)